MDKSTIYNGAKAYITDAVPDHKRSGYWQKAASDAFLLLEIESLNDSGLSGEIELVHMGTFGVAFVSSDSQIVRRSRRLIRGSEASSLIFLCQTAGSGIIRQDSRNILLEEGAITFVDSDRPYEFKFDDKFEQIVLQVPKDVFLSKCRWLAGSPPIHVKSVHPLAQIIQANLAALLKVGEALSNTISPKVLATIIDLLSFALEDSIENKRSNISETKIMHIQRAKQYMMQNLKESNLSPKIIAKACGISIRYLSELFSSEELTVSAWIRMQRLESARMEIERNRNASTPLNQIAYRWGFSDYTHFCRLFKSAYGLSPRNWRNKILGAVQS